MIQRYIIKQDPSPLPEMVKYSEGAYCLYSDHLAALEDQREAWRDNKRYLENDVALKREQIAALNERHDDIKRITKEISDFLHPDGEGPESPSLCDVQAYIIHDIAALTADRDDLMKKVVEIAFNEENLKTANAKQAERILILSDQLNSVALKIHEVAQDALKEANDGRK